MTHSAEDVDEYSLLHRGTGRVDRRRLLRRRHVSPQGRPHDVGQAVEVARCAPQSEQRDPQVHGGVHARHRCRHPPAQLGCGLAAVHPHRALRLLVATAGVNNFRLRSARFKEGRDGKDDETHLRLRMCLNIRHIRRRCRWVLLYRNILIFSSFQFFTQIQNILQHIFPSK